MNTQFARPGMVRIYDQLVALGAQVGRIRAALEERPKNVAPETVEEAKNLEENLTRISHKIESFEAEHANLLALANIGQVVNSSLEIDEVLRIVMDNIVRLTRAERGFLMLRENSGEMVTKVARNWEKESINMSELTVSRTIVQRVIESGEPLVTTNAQDDQRFAGQASIVAFNLRSILCVPLKVKNDLIGVIYTDNRIRTGIFSDTEKDLLVAFSNQAAVAIDNARLFSSLKQTLAEVTQLKNLMDNVFASITSGVITADVEDKITLANRSAESILGNKADEIIGRGLDEILPAFSEEIQHHLIEVRQKDQPVTDIEISHKLPERGNVDWRFNLSPLKDDKEGTQGVAIVLDDLTERKKLEAQRRLFERMVSPAVIEQLDPNSLQLGGKRLDITAVFADIRGFTSFSEKQSPEKLVRILNRYLAKMADAILAHEGTIDKFMGDAVMAWFNAPIPQKDHTMRAVKSALAIRDSFEVLYKELPKEEHLAFGVGINYGDAVLGLIGTEKRLEYTAISDTVNTAKRIQENSGKNQIIISKAAYERVKKEVNVKELAPMPAKGKAQPIEVFEVVGLK